MVIFCVFDLSRSARSGLVTSFGRNCTTCNNLLLRNNTCERVKDPGYTSARRFQPRGFHKFGVAFSELLYLLCVQCFLTSALLHSLTSVLLNVSSKINHRIRLRGFRKIVALFSQWSFDVSVCLIAGDLSQSAGYELLQFYRWLHRKYSLLFGLLYSYMCLNGQKPCTSWMGDFLAIFDTCKQYHFSLVLKSIIKPMDLLYFMFQFYLILILAAF